MSQTFTSDIINLNVGGTRFSTSRQTLCSSTPDSFFTSMLSGRIPTCRDDTGALFVDRDPKLFSIILHFLRTKELDLNGVDISVLKHEAEFYGVTPLVKRLMLCEDLDRSLCGDVLFTGFIGTPNIPLPSNSNTDIYNFNNLNLLNTTGYSSHLTAGSYLNASNINNNTQMTPNSTSPSLKLINNLNNSPHKPGNVLRLTTSSSGSTGNSIVSNKQPTNIQSPSSSLHSRNSSIDYVNAKSHSRKSSFDVTCLPKQNAGLSQLNASSIRNQDIKQMKTDLGILLTDNNTSSALKYNNNNITNDSNVQVNQIVGHYNWIAVSYSHFVCCYKLKDGLGWQLMFQSEHIVDEVVRIAINSKHQLTSLNTNLQLVNMNVSSPNSHSISQNHYSNTNTHNLNQANSSLGNANSNNISGSNIAGAAMNFHASGSASNFLNTSPSNQGSNLQPNTSGQQSSQDGQANSNNNNSNNNTNKLCALLAIAMENFKIRLWLVNDEPNTVLIGQFNLNAPIDNLFFIGSQLVSTSAMGKIGVWNSLSQLWQAQDIQTPITSFDTAGSFLLLGGQNGVLYYIDMQKFPLRMKDNDLLLTELYKDPSGDSITALSVYLTPKTSNTGNWIEIAYGTSTGQVRVIVQHPETVGHGPQLFQTFSVHRGSVIKVMLTEKHLVSVCSEFNHVRTWSVTRFRGMISTQPGSTPLASFKIVTIDALDSSPSYSVGNDIGPFGERENHQVFIQKVVPYTDQLFVRLSSTGKRICTIKSVDYSIITSFCVHECEGPTRLNSRPRRYLFTGHANGTVQLWDLTTALELKPCDQSYLGGPSASEFVRLLDQCDLATNTSGYSTPTTNANCISPCNNLISSNCNNFLNTNNNIGQKVFGKNLLVNSSNINNMNSQIPNLDEIEKN